MAPMTGWPPRFPSRTSITACALVFGAVGITGCALGTPRIHDGPGAPSAPSEFWPVPPAVEVAGTATLPTAVGAGLAGEVVKGDTLRELSLPEIVDLALRNSPTTRSSWALARAQADLYGATRGALYPTITGSASLSRVEGNSGSSGSASTGAAGDTTAATSGASGVRNDAAFTPSITLSYLIFDFGGRSGSVEAARQLAIAADLTHNAAVRDVVLQVESALFSFLANRALHDAQQVSVAEADSDLVQVMAFHDVGLVGIDEVLQARTAFGAQRLQLAALDANAAISFGLLDVAIGLPANARFTVPDVAVGDSVTMVAASVDTMIARAIRARPELARAQAQARELAAQVSVARAAGYPTLMLHSTGSYTRGIQVTPSGTGYSVMLGVQLPIFAGFTDRYSTRAAREQYAAGLVRMDSTRQAITLQVVAAYYTLQSATEQVQLSGGLLSDAQASADVAAGRYREGVGTLLELLIARNALVAARTASIQSHWEWRTALAQLGHDVGALDLRGNPNLIPAEPPR